MPGKQEKSAKAQKPEKGGDETQVTVRRSPQVVPTRAASGLWPKSLWERQVHELFDDLHRLLPVPRWWGGERWPAVEDLHVPAVDVFETADEIVVTAEAAGISKDDLEVSLSDTTLTIKGEKKKEHEIKEEHYYRSERSFGSFLRTVDLPATVRPDAATATFKDGVLEVRLPKTEEAKRKTIQVKVK